MSDGPPLCPNCDRPVELELGPDAGEPVVAAKCSACSIEWHGPAAGRLSTEPVGDAARERSFDRALDRAHQEAAP
jgi:hypothetical protein